jgi:sterol desaturase/sphingolipid hydroxylase (fatty acid hydroxylase superfamily)
VIEYATLELLQSLDQVTDYQIHESGDNLQSNKVVFLDYMNSFDQLRGNCSSHSPDVIMTPLRHIHPVTKYGLFILCSNTIKGFRHTLDNASPKVMVEWCYQIVLFFFAQKHYIERENRLFISRNTFFRC